MTLTGPIDGNAPPFILLGFALAGMAWLPGLILAIANSIGPSKFKVWISHYSIIICSPYFLLAFLMLNRIKKNWQYNKGITLDYSSITTFETLDSIAIADLYLCFSFLIVAIILALIFTMNYRFPNNT